MPNSSTPMRDLLAVTALTDQPEEKKPLNPQPPWWKRLSEKSQEVYISRHPKSRFSKYLRDRRDENELRTKPVSFKFNAEQRSHFDRQVEAFTDGMSKAKTRELRLAVQGDQANQDAKKDFFAKVGGVLAGGLAAALLFTPFAGASVYLGGYASRAFTGKDVFNTGFFDDNKDEEEDQGLRFTPEDLADDSSFKDAIRTRLKSLPDHLSYDELVKMKDHARSIHIPLPLNLRKDSK